MLAARTVLALGYRFVAGTEGAIPYSVMDTGFPLVRVIQPSVRHAQPRSQDNRTPSSSLPTRMRKFPAFSGLSLGRASNDLTNGCSDKMR
jgi:hypothetical protein